MYQNICKCLIFLVVITGHVVDSRHLSKTKNQDAQKHHKSQFGKARLDNRKDFKNNFDDIQLDRTPIVVELVVLIDETMYNYHGNDTEHYVAVILQVAQNLWQSLNSLAANVSLHISRLVVLDKQPDGLEAAEDANLYLTNLCAWKNHLKELYGKSLNYDVVLLITRTDLHIDGNYDARGIGYIMGACDTDHQCAIAEDTHPMGSAMAIAHEIGHTGIGYIIRACDSDHQYAIAQDTHPMGSAMAIAHEIGHTLGMWHDGIQFVTPCPDRTFIMSGYSVGGPRSLLWSQCSRKTMANFVRSAKADCLRNVPSSNMSNNFINRDNRLPGSIYNADLQCRILLGGTARDCTTWHGEGVCSELKCCPDEKSYNRETSKNPPLDGTTCGPNKVCMAGYCQNSTAQVAKREDMYPTSLQELNQLKTARKDRSGHLSTVNKHATIKPVRTLVERVMMEAHSDVDSIEERQYLRQLMIIYLIASVCIVCFFITFLRRYRRTMCRFVRYYVI